MTAELRSKQLRQEIHALRVKKFHWQLDGFKFIIKGLGYGDSLRVLSESKLMELKSMLLSYRKHGRPQSFTYDKQGRFMFALMKQAGWTDSELRAFMLQHFRKSHWNLLSIPERRAVIAMLQNYIQRQANPSKSDNNISNEGKHTSINNNNKENTNGTPKDTQT